MKDAKVNFPFGNLYLETFDSRSKFPPVTGKTFFSAY